jgi:hypothetical protein
MKHFDWKPGDLIVCETNAAIATHLRRLTTRGPQWGGGADSPALCGANARWDRRSPVSTAGCRDCIAALATKPTTEAPCR